MVARKGKAPELEMRKRRPTGEGSGESENGRGRANQKVRKGGGTGELRIAVKDKLGHVILVGVSWSEQKEEI